MSAIKEKPGQISARPLARSEAPQSRVETLARDLYVEMLGNTHSQWASSTLRHTAGKAISAANAFYEVLENGLED